MRVLKKLPIDLVYPGRYQPRKNFDQSALSELAKSLESQGQVQPIVVSPPRGGRYEIIMGERRWRAAQLVGWTTIEAIIDEGMSAQGYAAAYIENIQRKDLTALEEAYGLLRLIDEYKLTHEEAASNIGKSREYVTNTLRVLKTCAQVQTLMDRYPDDLSRGHVVPLVGLEPADQIEIAEKAVLKGLTVRAIEKLAKQVKDSYKGIRPDMEAQNDADIKRLEILLSEQLGSPSTIQFNPNSQRTRLTIDIANQEILEGLLRRWQINLGDPAHMNILTTQAGDGVAGETFYENGNAASTVA